jgi:serine/threonine protein kinase
MEYKKIAKKSVKYYHLIEIIGEGATGKVWLSVDERKNELLAIKVIPAQYLKQDEDGQQRLRRELTNLHKLKHENIIQIKGCENTKNNTYIALEFCNGGNLLQYQKYYQKKTKTTLNELYIQKLLRQITSGLEYMHEKKIIHRDIKLENILLNFDKYPNMAIKGKIPPKVNYDNISLSDSFTVKIADLGFSKDIEASNITATILGTPINMSPDMVENYNSKETKNYNTSVDLWSLGTITYELLTGKPAFNGKQYEVIFKQIMEGKYSLPSSLVVSVEIISFINGLLQYYPEKRLNWAQIKSHPFLTKRTDEFTYIELKSIAEGDKKNIELNAKNCDNLLWILFKGKKLNLNLDKINMNEMKNQKMKESINDNKVNNEEIKKAIEAEKKKIKEEKIRLEKEKLEAEKLKKEAEDIKNEVNLIKQKNEEKEKKLQNEEKKRKEMEEKLKKEGELNQQKEQEIKKQINDYQNQIQQLEKEKNENNAKLTEAEKLKKEAENITKEVKLMKEKNQLKEKQLREEELKRKEMEEKMKKEGELNQQKEQEIKRQMNEYQNQIKELEKVKQENDLKLKDAEKLLKNAEKLKKAAENQIITLNKNKELEEKKKKRGRRNNETKTKRIN